jgi:hypothetical protein
MTLHAIGCQLTPARIVLHVILLLLGAVVGRPILVIVSLAVGHCAMLMPCRCRLAPAAA